VRLRGRGGAYVIQAAIASLHADVEPDWAEVAALYGELVRLTQSTVVELNRAIAVAEAQGPEAGLALIEPLRGSLDGYRYLHAARAALLCRAGCRDAAAEAYDRAIELTATPIEREFLVGRRAALGG
jgi:RNA polymerase sigma-70 factor, ECF subfamily